MNKKAISLLALMVVFTLLISLLPTAAYANSAEPPSMVILINNPSDDLSIALVSDENKTDAIVRRVAWEGYYVFYKRDMKAYEKYTFKISTKDENFECTITESLKQYNNVYTLDLSSKEITLYL